MHADVVLRRIIKIESHFLREYLVRYVGKGAKWPKGKKALYREIFLMNDTFISNARLHNDYEAPLLLRFFENGGKEFWSKIFAILCTRPSGIQDTCELNMISLFFRSSFISN